MKRVMLSTALLLLGATTAQAQDIKPYAGVSIGAFGIENKGTTVNQNNTLLGAVGKFGVDINEYFGGEIRLGTTSRGTTGTTSQKSSYFASYLAKAQLPVSGDFNVYTVLGATTAKVQLTQAGTTTSRSKTGLSYGFGGAYSVADKVSVGAEWVQYWTDVKSFTGNKTSLWGIAATATFHF